MSQSDAVPTVTGLVPAGQDPGVVRDALVGVLGFGPLLAAHALNVRDRGVEVLVGVPAEGRAAARVAEEGLTRLDPADLVRRAEILVVEPAVDGIDTGLLAAMPPGRVLVLADSVALPPPEQLPHGVDVLLVRSVADPERLRRESVDGRPPPVVAAVHRDVTGRAEEVLTGYTAALGCALPGVIRTTLEHDARARTFAGDVVHDGVRQLLETGYEVLTDQGVAPEVAYLAVVHELQDQLAAVGVSGFASAHGPDGGVHRPPLWQAEELRARLERAWRGHGRAAPEPAEETVPGSRAAARRAAHPLEQTGRRVRAVMGWVRA